MKKLLALVLALVMTLGLATVGANAAYSDADEVSFKEAVDVMSAVGVFQGNETGKFLPKANLDRASAAKLIAYLDLGKTTAEALPAVKVFNDVPETHWAAKYIAYCADAGYITGYEGNFYPASELTGYAFGKMLLCVLGFDAKIEGYEGSSWTIAVAKGLSANKITKGVEGNPSKTLTREEAAQYCFNALFAKKVAYASTGTTITVGGVEITTGASKAEADEYAIPNQTLADALDYDLTKVDADENTDAFGRPTAAWLLDGEVIGEYPAEATKTYTTAVKGGKLYTDLGKARNLNVTAIWDGDEYELDEDFEIASGNPETIGGTGILTEVYKDGANVTIVMISTSVGKIVDVFAAKTNADGEVTTKAYIKVKEIGGNTYNYTTDAFKKADKGTVVLYTWSNAVGENEENIQSVAVADSEKDVTVRSLSAGKVNSYTVAAENYLAGIERGGSYDMYFDAYGNLIYNEEVAAAENNNFVYVLKVGTPVATLNEYGEPVDPETVKALYIDATGKTTQVDADVDALPAEGTWNTFTEKDGVCSFTEVEGAVYGAADTIKASIPQLTDGLKANNNTTFVVKTKASPATYKVYEGLKSVPTMIKENMLVTGLNNDAGYAKLVYVDATGASGASTTVATPVFVLDWVSDDIDDDDVLYSVYDAIVGKELTRINVKDGVAVPEGIVTLTKNSKGYVTAFNAYDAALYDIYELDEDNAVAFVEGTLELPGQAAQVLDESVAVYVFEDGALTASTAGAELDGADEGTLVVMFKDNNGTIDYFYWAK